ncbi:Putative bifunctional phosphatase/peptidyl-prolyl cis-trans isomerase [Paenibacillus solanacearum]|uniref:Bifunctional phosphatase/peptidyl-prolyl cis-trans isomerase n=1 Tax=Paenibacillus solanacearum TaxID=2048548 RepID=A0A916K8W6_9BACL|nr:Cof-type HAD-IIB family hydrolase [Paenibacillus solanacearum]CAG7646141.1 Putative bifunctional phosphatase/peptidyl-prolyl cis-trans isomerase [Paenibacillus solanacearum]
MGKLVFFDIDDTLVNHHKQVPDSAKQAIRELKARGVEVAIATGRAPVMFKHLMKELDIQSFVGCNGSYAVYRGEVVYKKNINDEALHALEAVAAGKGHPMAFSDENVIWVNRNAHPYVERAIGDLRAAKPHYRPQLEQDKEIYYALAFCEEGAEQYIHDFPQFRMIRWHPYSLDILPAGGSKAKGIEVLLEKTGIRREDTFAFGDGLNDVEMLKFVGTGIAMGNACEEAKEASDFVTKAVSEDGVKYGLQMMGLLG